MPSKPVSIILALVLFAAAAVACGPLPDDERDGPQSTRSAQSLTSISINPINPNLPKLSLPTTDVMTWNAWGTGRGAHWRLSDYGVVRVRTALTHPRGWNLVGVAGDRVLWASGSGGAELWTIDSNNQRVATHTLPSPGSGYSAVGLAQASPLAWNCYRTGAEQNYYVAWDAIPDAESREGRWAVQLVAGDG